MPDSPSSSAPSPTPSSEADDGLEPLDGRTLARHGAFLLATAISVFFTGVTGSEAASKSAGYFAAFRDRTALLDGLAFAGGLLGFLLVHELAHYIAARLHRVPASLPFFLPLPFLSPFGTLGAVIRMRGTIRDRAALLDVGASGPLAGLCVAIPLYLYGVAHSKVISTDGIEGVELGDSLLLKLMDHVAAPHYGAGQTILLPPIAYAAWGGLFVTMINLLPLSQLDGGHVAYALFGDGHNRRAPTFHRLLLAFFTVNLSASLVRDALHGVLLANVGNNVGRTLFWFVWFEMLGILGGFARARHAEAREDDDPEDGNDGGEADRPAELSPRVRAAATLGIVLYSSFARESHSALVWLPWFGALGLLLALEARSGLLRPHDLLAHPPTDAASKPLGATRKVIAIVTLAFFVLLFLPTPMAL
jgi:membrane-associated protease RseP (regulator of RpoE activity)